MSDVALRMEHVYKKFARGERHDTLRDLLPALTRSFLKRVTRPFDLKSEEFWALQDISFEIKQGEAVGIIGHNGAGKSTILKHLSGIMKPTMGRIDVTGKLSALIEVGAGFHQDLTGRENVFLNGVILGMTRQEVQRRFDAIVEFSGLADFIDTPVKRYSSGMYARLGFSVAAHMEPDILIIDEVLSVGDATFQARGVEKMRSILNSGATVIFVSHSLKSISDLCPRSILMKKGTVVEDGPTSHVLQTYMTQVRETRKNVEGKDVIIEQVVLRDQQGPRADFTAGDKAWVEVTLLAQTECDQLDCMLILRDERYNAIFDTSARRLGVSLPKLKPGDRFKCTFELDLHLAFGTFHVSVKAAWFEAGRILDDMDPAATLHMRTPIDVRGSANLYPRVTGESV